MVLEWPFGGQLNGAAFELNCGMRRAGVRRLVSTVSL